MGNTREVSGKYGRGNRGTILVYEDRNGLNWYCVEGSVNVNGTYEEIGAGCNIEEVRDVDTFTASNPIESLEELERLVEDN